MKVNFEIEHNHALIVDGRRFDLHNAFDFTSYRYDSEKKVLVLHWKLSQGDVVNKDGVEALSLVHKGVSYFRIETGGGSAEDDGCLLDVTYYPASEREVNDYVTEKVTPDSDDDILYQFAGAFIRVHAKEIEATLQ